MNIIIPMAGLGSRFKEEGFLLPKPLIMTNGKTLIEHAVESLGVFGQYIFITREFEDPMHNEALSLKLKEIQPNSIEILLKSHTRGAVETCLAAEKYIKSSEPLIITNCDQITEWEVDDFLKFVSNEIIDGAVVTYPSTNPKNSFAVVENDLVTELVEKKAVTDIALIGIHYWKRGSDFILSAKKLLEDFEITGRPECYVSESFNYLIKEGRKIKNFHILENQYISLGTPYDLKIYQGKIKEFHTKKPMTIFCDIDGTILKHVHRFSDIKDAIPEVLDGVIEKMNLWDSLGHKIILVTARKESARLITEKHLNELGLCWDVLLMGVSSGRRVLINDKLNFKDADRAVAINVITNGGFSMLNWEDVGL